MLLIKKLYKLGDAFFRYRSYMPMLLVAFLILEIPYFHQLRSSGRRDAALDMACLSVSLCGYAIRVAAVGYARKGTSGRSTKEFKSDSLNTDGIYAVVRNPLYLGNFFIILGLSMMSRDWRMVLINILLFICFYFPIILREEDYLRASFGGAFDEYAGRVPAVVPDLRRWRRPEMRFNVARVLRREHDSLAATVITFFAIEILRTYATAGRFRIDHLWTWIVAVTLILWGILKFAKDRLKAMEKDSCP